jgi:hypothetical protein
MATARVAAVMPVFATSGPPPKFRITFDAGQADVNIEIAKAPNYLAAPVSDATDPWTQFDSMGGKPSNGVAAQTLRINTEGWVDYTLPQQAWDGLKRNARYLYYRVRIRDGSGQVWLSHTDEECQTGHCPTLGLLTPPSGPAQNAPQSAVTDLMTLWDRLFLAVLTVIPEEAARLGRVIAHPTYTGASNADRASILTVFVRCGYNGRGIFDALLALQVTIGSNVQRAALMHRDERNEGRMLDHLLALSEAPLHADVTSPTSEILYDLMFEIIDPGALNQGYAGSCAATSAQIYVNQRNPAEIARWGRYLLDRRHLRVRLANQDYMRTQPIAFRRATWLRLPVAQRTNSNISLLTRTYSERAIQCALMDYGNYRHRYNPERDQFRNALGTWLGSGLWCFEITRLFEGIFNEPWVWNFGGGSWDAPNSTAATTGLMQALRSPDPCLMVMRWGSSNGSHAVVGQRIQRVDGTDRVIFRNPQYRGRFPAYATASTHTQPTRRSHDAARAEESMDQAGLNAALIGYMTLTSQSTERGFRLSEIPGHLQSTVTPTNNT